MVESRTQQVLVVDDLADQRAIFRAVLENRGFQVLEAASPAHALDIAQQYKESLDLLLTDMVMPGMSGRQLADRVRQEHPDLPVLYTTGYELDASADQFGGSGSEEILRKPFDPDVLVGRVERAISR